MQVSNNWKVISSITSYKNVYIFMNSNDSTIDPDHNCLINAELFIWVILFISLDNIRRPY